MPRARDSTFGIIADDLTGATDTAAAFARAGFGSAVVLDNRTLPMIQTEVVALTTDSRQDAPAVARAKVRRACALLARSGRSLLYKKMDSTVKGNIVAEVEAARDTTGFRAALVCPANPAQGRIVCAGVLQVRGGKAVDLVALFGSQGLHECKLIKLPVSPARARSALAAGKSFIIGDARTEHDLRTLVRAGLQAIAGALLAGSAGMAGQLALLLRNNRRPGRVALCRPPKALRTRGTILLVGSNNPVTQRQISRLARSGAASLRLSSGLAAVAGAALESGRPVVLRIPIYECPRSVLMRQLTRLQPLLASGRVGTLLLSGGDTARLVCDWLRPRAILIGGELLPGLAWGRFEGGKADGLTVCTKPGGFGEEDALLTATRLLS